MKLDQITAGPHLVRETARGALVEPLRYFPVARGRWSDVVKVGTQSRSFRGQVKP